VLNAFNELDCDDQDEKVCMLEEIARNERNVEAIEERYKEFIPFPKLMGIIHKEMFFDYFN